MLSLIVQKLDAIKIYEIAKSGNTDASLFNLIPLPPPPFFSTCGLGTFGTMGVGLGFAIASALWCQAEAPNKRVICVEGDSAFGFSGMEVETMFR